jgi:hypothetical protein
LALGLSIKLLYIKFELTKRKYFLKFSRLLGQLVLAAVFLSAFNLAPQVAADTADIILHASDGGAASLTGTSKYPLPSLAPDEGLR